MISGNLFVWIGCGLLLTGILAQTLIGSVNTFTAVIGVSGVFGVLIGITLLINKYMPMEETE